MTRLYAPCESPSVTYRRNECGVQQEALGGESAYFSGQQQTGYQHKHLIGGHGKNSDHLSAFISLRSRYGTTRTSKIECPEILLVFSFRFARHPMANRVDCIKIYECCRGPFLSFSLLPNALICKDYLLSSTISPFLIIHSYISSLHAPPLTQRTEIPDLLVNIRDAMFIDANSWKSSLAA
jgi:hypothetical protein